MLDRFGRRFVINLPTRTDRLRETRRELTRIGQGGSVEILAATRPTDVAGFGSLGEHGCFLSHLDAWRTARDAPSVLVLEDDVGFAPDFVARAAVLDALPEDWEILYGGHMQLPALRRTWHERGLVRIEPSVEFIGLHCYAVNGHALPRLIAAVEGFLSRPHGHALGGRMPIDGALNEARRRLGFATYAVMPPLAYQRASRTDIGSLRWFDRTPMLSGPIRIARGLKDRIKHARPALGN